MERHIITLAVALGALYLVGKHNVIATIRRGGGFTEIGDNVFAIKDNFGRYLRCEDADGNVLDDARCGGQRCGFTGCPDDDEEER